MASDVKRLTQSEAIEVARGAVDNQERLREKLALSEAVVRDGCEMHTEALDSLTAELAASQARAEEWRDKALVMAYAVRDQVSVAETHIIARQVIEHDAALAEGA